MDCFWWQYDDTFSGSNLNRNSPHCTFFEHLLLIVSSTTNALPRRLLLLRQDGNHIQKCPFVSRASCVTFSVQQPFHQTRNKKINLSWSAYPIARNVYVVSFQKKKVFQFAFYLGFKYSALSSFWVGESKIFCYFNSLLTIQKLSTQSSTSTRSSEKNIAQDINNHLRSIDIFRSMII